MSSKTRQRIRQSRPLVSEHYNRTLANLSDSQEKWKNPPNNGQPVVEHIDTFVALYTSHAKTYLNPDVAYQENKSLQRAMLVDPVVMEPLRARQLSVALLDWSIKPEDEENEKHKETCEKLERAVRRIPYFTRFRMALLEALWFGRYGVQIPWMLGWDVETNTPRLDFNRRKRWLPVHGDKFRLRHQDECLGIFIRGATTAGRSSFGDEARIHWIEKQDERDCFIFHQHEILDGDYFDPKSAGSIMGLGLRHRVWWPWYFKQNLSGWIHEFAQRVGTGTEVWYFDQDNNESYAKVKAAAEAHSGQKILLVPRGGEMKTRGAGFERIEVSTGGAQFLESLLENHWCSQIKMMIAGQTLTSETGATGLGSNVAEQHANTKVQYQALDAANLDETLTIELLGPMCNYPTQWNESWYPRFESSVKQPDPAKLMSAARQFYEMGGDVAEDELRETAGLRKPRHGEKKLSKSAQQQGGGEPGMPQGEQDGDDDASWLDGMFGDDEQQEAA